MTSQITITVSISLPDSVLNTTDVSVDDATTAASTHIDPPQLEQGQMDEAAVAPPQLDEDETAQGAGAEIAPPPSPQDWSDDGESPPPVPESEGSAEPADGTEDSRD
jgi:hypothetical protein